MLLSKSKKNEVHFYFQYSIDLAVRTSKKGKLFFVFLKAERALSFALVELGHIYFIVGRSS